MHFHPLPQGGALPPLPSDGNFTMAGRDRLLVLRQWPQGHSYIDIEPQPDYDVYVWRDDLGWGPVAGSTRKPVVAWAFLRPDEILADLRSSSLGPEHCPCWDRWTWMDSDRELATQVAVRIGEMVKIPLADLGRLEELSWWLDKALHGFPAYSKARAEAHAGEVAKGLAASAESDNETPPPMPKGWRVATPEEMQGFRLTPEEVAYGQGLVIARPPLVAGTRQPTVFWGQKAPSCPDLPQQVGEVGSEGDRPAEGQGQANPEDLRPCPFCGGPASLAGSVPHLHCECAKRVDCLDEWVWIDVWNRRPIEDRLREELGRVELDLASERAWCEAFGEGNRRLEQDHAEAMALVLSHEGVIERLQKDLAGSEKAREVLLALRRGTEAELGNEREQRLELLESGGFRCWALGFEECERRAVERLRERAEDERLVSRRTSNLLKDLALEVEEGVLRQGQYDTGEAVQVGEADPPQWAVDLAKKHAQEIVAEIYGAEYTNRGQHGNVTLTAPAGYTFEPRGDGILEMVPNDQRRWRGTRPDVTLVDDYVAEAGGGLSGVESDNDEDHCDAAARDGCYLPEDELPSWAQSEEELDEEEIFFNKIAQEINQGMEERAKADAQREKDYQTIKARYDEEEIFTEELGRVVAEDDPDDWRWARHVVCGLIRWSLNFRESDDPIHFYIRRDLSSLLSNVEQAAKRARKEG